MQMCGSSHEFRRPCMTTVISIDISVFMSFDHYILYLISEDQKKKSGAGGRLAGEEKAMTDFRRVFPWH